MAAPEDDPVATRIAAAPTVTGALDYAADIARPGMLHARVLRSPLAHARIVSVEPAAARTLPGVHAVLTAADLPDYRLGRSMRDMPVLARDQVRFVGEKVAAVVAESVELAEEALALIRVEYEELPAVFDPLEAMLPGAPLIHDPDLVRAWKTPAQRVGDYPNSVSNPVWGASEEEIARALAASHHVFEHTFHTPVQHQGYLEPHVCTVELDERGVAHVWASNKAPFLLLDYLERGIELPRDRVEIHLMPLGGDFGGKGSFMDIPLTYFLARATGRAVRLRMSYTEELMAGNPRHAAVVSVRSGFDAEGRLLARWTRSVYNSGAYAAFKPAPDATLPRVRYGGIGAYPEVSTWRVEGHMVYTNTVPCGHMRAPGAAQPNHAIECHMDLCARAMGIDPLQLRLINAPRRPRQDSSGQPIPQQAGAALQTAGKAIGLGLPRPTGIGRGIALMDVMNSPADAYTARLAVLPDGTVVFRTPMVEQGSGMLTAFRLLAAEALDVPPERVRVEQTMEGIEYDRGVGGSRITRVLGKMIRMLAERVQDRLAEALAGELGHPPELVTRQFGGGFLTPDGRLHTLAQAASLVPGGVDELLRYQLVPEDVCEAYGAVAAEVAVDGETGGVRVRRLVTALEVGKIVNPIMHQGQIDGGLIQGLGYALGEGLVFDEGRVVNANLGDYKLPVGPDVPDLETILLPAEPRLGITPIGEGPNYGASAAIVNAIMDVVGRQVEIPVSPEAIAGLDSAAASRTSAPPASGSA